MGVHPEGCVDMCVCVFVCARAGVASPSPSAGTAVWEPRGSCSVLKEAGACPLNGLPMFPSSRGDAAGISGTQEGCPLSQLG